MGAGRLVAIVGNYGSGKTEIAVNLALSYARAGLRVQIADLDLVNPYFRCREALDLMASHGIRVVVPPGAQLWADLPIVLPEIQGMLQPPEGTISIFDVGGDDVGARALSAFRPRIREGEYELWQVINAKRPFTDTVEGCLAMRDAIEGASRWRVTGFIANAHLITETTAHTILEGWRLARAVADRTGLPIRGVAVMHDLPDLAALFEIDAPLIPLHRHMLPPWSPSRPARPVPLGVVHGSHQY